MQLEVGTPGTWKELHVVLAGATVGDLGLYYYESHVDDAAPLGCIYLHSAHIDVLEVRPFI